MKKIAIAAAIMIYAASTFHNYKWMQHAFGVNGGWSGQHINALFAFITFVPVFNTVAVPVLAAGCEYSANGEPEVNLNKLFNVK